MNRKARARIASDTLAILEACTYYADGGRQVDIADFLHNCLDGTQQFGPDKLHRIRDAARISYHCTLRFFQELFPGVDGLPYFISSVHSWGNFVNCWRNLTFP